MLRVNCICTAISISLSPSPRQWGCRYTIRAGRNLPDKEFRYLRTVIVTAAVYWGFGSPLLLIRMTDPLNLPAPGRCQTLYVHFTCLQSPVFLVNSRNPHFSAAQLCFRCKTLHTIRPTFFRSYGGNLPSSLERVLSNALGFSPHPPESVYGTDASGLHAMLFLEAWDHLRRCLVDTLGDLCSTFLSYATPLQRPAEHLHRSSGYPSPSHLASTTH